MAERARAAGVKLRPHAKTHKVPEIARLQRAAGAAGLSVAKTSEAEVFADAGFDDLFVAYPVVGADKARRLLALADRVRLAVGVDSVEGARTLAGAVPCRRRARSTSCSRSTSGSTASASTPAAARRLRPPHRRPSRPAPARRVHPRRPRVRGRDAGRGRGRSAARRERSWPASAPALARDGLGPLEVSVGSTPTARHAMTVAGVTECRPGQLRLQRRLPGLAGDVRPRRLRADRARHRGERPRAGPRGAGRGQQDAFHRSAPPARGGLRVDPRHARAASPG